VGHGGSAIGYEHNRTLGAFYPTNQTSNALRRYGGISAGHGGSAISYEHNRALGDLNLPRPGAPEVVEGYESPQPNAAIVHLGRTVSYPWDEQYPGQSSLSGFIPEGAIRNYGEQAIEQPFGADAAPKQLDLGLLRKASVLAAAYHGVKRHNGSVIWGLLWGVAAYVTPLYGVLVPLIGAAQGFGQAKVKSNPARRSKMKTKKFRRSRRGLAKTKRRSKAKTRKYPSYFSPKHGAILNPRRRRRR
jgi:hypothetical protein